MKLLLRKKFLVFFGVVVFLGIVAAGSFQDNSQSDFDSGSYFNTFYNSSGYVQLDFGQSSGGFLSRVFDSGSASTNWSNISLGIGLCYYCELPGNEGFDEGYLRGNVSMTGNRLLAHFDESSGTLVDSSGRGNNGSALGGVTYGASGKYRSALDFDGNNDRGDFGDKSDFEGMDALTIEAWVNADRYDNPNGNNFPSIVDKRYDRQYSFYFNSFGTVVVDIDTNTGNYNTIGTSVLSTDEWHHVVFTYDGNNLDVFVDGVLENSTSASGTISNGNRNLLVGAGWNGNSRSFYFDGTIDEVALYNRALSAEEVENRYLRGIVNLDLGVRSCDDSVCSGEVFQDANESVFQDLAISANRYFQYMVNFSSNDSFSSSELYNFEVSYEDQNSAPNLSVTYPWNVSYSIDVTELNYTIYDAESNLDSCWYSLDNGVSNVSLVCGENVTGLLANQGGNSWSVWGNDSSGEIGYGSVSFFVDSLNPNVSIEFPVGGESYGDLNLDLNYSVIESNLDSCWYSLDNGITNTSLPGCTNSSIVVSSGANFLIVWASDSLGNEGSDSITFSVDSVPPGFSNFIETPSNGSSYLFGESYVFNVSVSDDSQVGSVGIDFEGVNYSALGAGGDYTHTIFALGAGVYSYYWWANDSAGNFNSSSDRYFSVLVASNYANLTNSQTWNIVYPSEATIGIGEASEGDGDVSYVVFRDNVSVGSGETVTLGAGSYHYLLNTTGGQNYSGGLLDNELLIVEKGNSSVNLTINGTESDLNIFEGESVLINGTLLDGDSSGILRLYVDGEVINEGVSEVSNNTLFSSQGNYNVSLFYLESENYSSSSKTYFVNVSIQGNRAPRAVYNSPANNSNSTLSYVTLNVSVFDEDLDNVSVLFYGDGALLQTVSSVVNGSVESYVWSNLSNGEHNWSVIVNDGEYNSSEEYWFFNINNSVGYPEVSIDYPSYSSSYGDLSNVPLNFSVSYSGSVECFYNIDEGVNNSITNCENTTFSVPSDGDYNITVYARESFANHEGFDSEVFFVKDGRPNVHLVYPNQDHYTNSSEIYLKYVPYSDTALSRCELWGAFNDSYQLIETDLTIQSGEENNFSVSNMSEGSAIWAVGCLDGDGDYVLSGNRTLTTDYTPPSVSIDEPNGTYSDTSVPLTYEVNDSSPVVTCAYNLSFSSNGQNLEVNIITDCENTVINVQGDGDYELDLSAFDAASNGGDSETSFSVDSRSSGSSGGSSGGGGGGGGGGSSASGARLSYANLPGLSIKKGRSAVVSFTVINSGSVFLNNCQMVPTGPFAGLIDSSQVEDLSLGQSATFVFELGIPKEFSSGTYDLGIDVACDETTASIPLQVVVAPSSFDFEFLGTERDVNNLQVSYILEELSGNDQDITLNYRLENRDGEIVVSGNEFLLALASSRGEYGFEIELPQDSFGEFRLYIDLESELDQFSVVQNVVLSSSGLTGLAVSDNNRRTLTYSIGFLVGIALLFFATRFIFKHYKKTNKKHHKGRKLIKLHLK